MLSKAQVKQPTCPRNYVLGRNRDGVLLCYPVEAGRPIPTQFSGPFYLGLGDALPTCGANPLCDPSSGACADASTGQPCTPAAPASAGGGSSLGLYITSGLAILAAGFIGWSMNR